MTIDLAATERTRARYERIAPRYDAMERFSERRVRPWRAQLWSLVRGPKVLEVGVGTGKNMAYYPGGLEITAIDLASGMLDRAQRHAATLGISVDLQLGDVQALRVPDNSFDEAVSTFVICSVPNPILGLTELLRVIRPGGHVYLLEHTRSANPVLGTVMDFLNPLVVRMMGANINRRTVDNVRSSGLQVEKVEDMRMNGMVKLITATKSASDGRTNGAAQNDAGREIVRPFENDS